MHDCTSYTVSRADWPQDAAAIRSVRNAVFVAEQAIPPGLEWDGLDPECSHVLARDRSGTPIGTGRLLPDGRIGRMAVLPGWRGRGVGQGLLAGLLAAAAARGQQRVYLHAQVKVAGFYRRAGFMEYGERFTEAGILHVAMMRDLAV